MEVYMTFIIATFVIIIGGSVFSFTVSNMILLIFFSIPFTIKLNNACLLKANRLIYSHILAILFQLIIFTIVTFVFYFFYRDGYFMSLLVGYFFGFIGVLTSLKKFGLNMNNFKDYFELNKDFFWEELVNMYDTDKVSVYEYINSIIKKS
jgi:hypothetical protein